VRAHRAWRVAARARERRPRRAHPYAAWFDGIGCHTLGDLRHLPRPGLQRRCGRELLDLLDAAYGLVPELYEWIAPPETFRARLELYDRIDDADLLLARARRRASRSCWPNRRGATSTSCAC
jgi:hypothetical protein